MLALLAQLESVFGDPGANAVRAVAALEAHPEADLAVFPELFLSAYHLPDVTESARPAGCDELCLVAAAAAAVSTGVVIGFAERLEGGGARTPPRASTPMASSSAFTARRSSSVRSKR